MIVNSMKKQLWIIWERIEIIKFFGQESRNYSHEREREESRRGWKLSERKMIIVDESYETEGSASFSKKILLDTIFFSIIK